jgi:hypothetical protein
MDRNYSIIQYTKTNEFYRVYLACKIKNVNKAVRRCKVCYMNCPS